MKIDLLLLFYRNSYVEGKKEKDVQFYRHMFRSMNRV